ncbi:MAG: dihydrolipoyl dehydrogenase [Phycisphaerales bacterium]
MASKHFDVVVIGGGPGGYVGAIRAAQIGYKVAIIERAKLGGVCLNWGCIPSKALIANAELMEKLAEQEEWGISTGEVKFEWDKIIGRSRGVAEKLNKGVEFLMKKNKIEFINAHAKITKANGGPAGVEIEIHDCALNEEFTPSPVEVKGAKETITCDKVIIATGAVARDLPFAKFDGDKIWGAREAMNNTARPDKLIIVGAGAIGMEFGYVYKNFGTEVTIIEMMDRLVPVEDEQVGKEMTKIYKKHGFNVKVKTGVLDIDSKGKGVKVTCAPMGKDGKPDESKKEVLEADKVLLAIGVGGRFDGLFDESLGLETVRGHIKTDYVPLSADTPSEPKALDYKTNLPGVYAIGDVIGPPWLAHVAGEEAVLCVERFAFKDGKAKHDPIPMDYTVIPGCTYCHPQVGSVGYTEQALKAQGLKKGEDYEVGVFQNQALGKAIATRHTDGFVKIIRGLPRGEILGTHILGDQATELIAEMSLARRLEATTEEIIATVHAHPTMHEAVHEAALASEGRVINS